MTIHKLKSGILVELPDGSTDIELVSRTIFYKVYGFIKKYILPTGFTYTSITAVPSMSEVEAAELVEKPFHHKFLEENEIYYRDYEEKDAFWENTAIESLHSLCRSLGMNPKNSIYIK